jgi:hypothetical protein
LAEAGNQITVRFLTTLQRRVFGFQQRLAVKDPITGTALSDSRSLVLRIGFTN